jgi:hypothetical protein
MTKVFFTLVPCPQAEWEGEPYRNFVLNLFHQQKAVEFQQKYSLARDEDSADLIVILEPASFKTKEYAKVLWTMRAVNLYPTRLFTINQDDAPLAFFPGLYAAMPVERFESGFTAVAGYLVNSPNQFVVNSSVPAEPSYLFSFRGAVSSAVRRKMARDWSTICPGVSAARFTAVDAWFNHTAEQKRDYVQDILDSKFILCPCGQGTASHRLFEVMQLGRVPVILADSWMEPPGPNWSEFSLRVPESELGSIAKLLAARESEFPQMAKKAREAWEEFFAPETRLGRMLNQLQNLYSLRTNLSADFRLRWSHRDFYRGNLGTIWGRIGKRFRQPI